MKVGLILSPCTKLIEHWIKDLNVRLKLNLLEEDKGEASGGIVSGLQQMIPVAWKIIPRIYK